MKLGTPQSLLILALALGGCVAPLAPQDTPAVSTTLASLRGQVRFGPPSRAVQAEMSEVGNAATVSLLDATSGNTLGSSVTDASGNFVLTFDDLIPTNGSGYVLEAVKGLSVGGAPNRAGAGVVRVRTLLFWDNGWKSLTNATPGSGIVVSAATTALSTVVSLKKNAGTTIALSSLIGKINPTDSTFNDGGTGLTATADYTPVLGLVQSAILLDQDPVEAIAFDASKGTYSLATGIPSLSGYSPASLSTGSVMTLRGANLDRLIGRNSFVFGAVAAATWSISTDRTSAGVTVPDGAFSGPVTLQQPGGVTQLIAPFLKIRGTMSTFAGTGVQLYRDGTGLSASFYALSDAALDPAGNLYVTEPALNRIRKVTPAGVVSTFAGTGASVSSDGTGTAAGIHNPCSITLAPNGNFYFTEYNGNRVRMMTPAGVVTTLAGSGTATFSDGSGTAGQFNNPWGITADPAGNLYVADRMNHRIRKVTPAGVVSTLAGNGTATSVDGTGTAATINQPLGVWADGSGNVFVAEYSASKLRKIDPSGVVTTVAGNGTAGFTDGTGTNARFNNPIDVEGDAAGNLYVVDNGNHRIRKVTSAGVVSTLAGSGAASSIAGPLLAGSFNTPYGATVAPDGTIYVCERYGYRVSVIVP